MELGSWGWDWDAWEGVFYPEDLPEDWRLSFYANEFPLVVIPGEQAALLEVPTLLMWARDLPPQFGFLVEAPKALRADGQGRGRLIEVLAALGGRLRGLLWPVEGSLPEQLQAFREAGGLDLALLHLLGEPHGPGWQAAGEGVGQVWTRDPCGDLTVDGPAIVESSASLAELREAVESYLRITVAPRPCLILSGEPPDPTRLREVRTLLELMGL
jgi:hypothetical protein